MKFVYKCRRCGKLEQGTRCGGNNGDAHMTSVIHLLNAVSEKQSEAMAPKLLSIHSCGELMTGISDLIGCEPD